VEIEASAEEAKQEEDSSAAHRRMRALAMVTSAAQRRVRRGGPGVCGVLVRLGSGPNCAISWSRPPMNPKMGSGLDHRLEGCFQRF
jgi:hypothetical protein